MVLNDTIELTENALPIVRNISGEINLRLCCACAAATLCCSAKNISKFTNATYSTHEYWKSTGRAPNQINSSNSPSLPSLFSKGNKNVPPSSVILVAGVNNGRLTTVRSKSSRNWINLRGNTHPSDTRRSFFRFMAVRSFHKSESSCDLNVW